MCFGHWSQTQLNGISSILLILELNIVFTLPEIDKCNDPDYNNCDPVGGQCQSSAGLVNCTCKEGYVGDGTTCTGRLNCS